MKTTTAKKGPLRWSPQPLWMGVPSFGRSQTTVPSAVFTDTEVLVGSLSMGESEAKLRKRATKPGPLEIPDHDHAWSRLKRDAPVRDILRALRLEGGFLGEPVFLSALYALRERGEESVAFSVFAYPSSARVDGKRIAAQCVAMRNDGPKDQYGVRAHSHSVFHFFDTIEEALDFCETWDPPPVVDDPCACVKPERAGKTKGRAR